MFMVLSSWQSHCESSPGSFDECRMAPSGRRPKTKPDDLGCEYACTGCQKLHPPSPPAPVLQVCRDMGTAGRGKKVHLSLENVKARLASVTTFRFAQKEPKSLPPDTFHELMRLLATGRTALLRSPDPLAAFKEAASQREGEGKVNREGRKETRGERENGRKRESRWKDRGR